MFLAFRRKGQTDLKEFAFGVYAKRCVLSVARLQTHLHVFQPHASRAARGSFRIPRILDDNRQAAVLPSRSEPDFTALRKTGDAMFDGVLDERLQQQRRQRQTLDSS